MKKLPPQTGKGASVNAKFKAMEGVERTCESCGETKVISMKTFSPKKTEPDGVSKVCRACQGRKSQKLVGARTIDKVEPWPNSQRKRKEFWERLTKERDRLYEIGNQVESNPRLLKEFEVLCHSLHMVTRMKGDPAEGGHMEDEKLAFKIFCEVISPLIAGWTGLAEIHEDVIDALVDPDDHVMLLASRNSGKSALTQIFVAWCLYRNPLDMILVFSSSEDIAKRGLMAVRNYLEDCPLLRFLLPKEGGIDSANKFTTAQAIGKLGSNVSLAAYGINGRTTGLRAERMIFDDVESSKDTTQTTQEALYNNTNAVENLLNPGGQVIALGTPQIIGASIYIKWAESGDWKLHTAKLFEELPNDDGKKEIELRSRWPDRWSDADLKKKRKRLPKHEWDLHWRIDLDTKNGDDRPIKLRYFYTVSWPSDRNDFPPAVRGRGPKIDDIEIGEAPDANDYLRRPIEITEGYEQYAHTVAAVDPSGGGGGDEIGICVASATVQGQAVIRYLSGIDEGEPTKSVDRLVQTLNRFRPDQIIVEDNNGSAWPTMLEQKLNERGYYPKVERATSQTRKGERIISALEVPLNNEKVILLDDVVTAPNAVETIRQIVGIKRDARGLKHDDRVDALAWALSTLSEKWLFLDNGDVQETQAQKKKEYLLTLTTRQGGIREDSPEATLLDWDDEDTRLAHQIEHLTQTLEEEKSRGVHDLKLERRINHLREQFKDSMKRRNHKPLPPPRPYNLGRGDRDYSETWRSLL